MRDIFLTISIIWLCEPCCFYIFTLRFSQSVACKITAEAQLAKFRFMPNDSKSLIGINGQYTNSSAGDYITVTFNVKYWKNFNYV